MTHREYRRMALTPEEKERLDRRACPVCGTERENFQPRNRTAVCCKPACSEIFWHQQRPTVAGMRRLIYKEQDGKCAACHQPLPPQYDSSYILDHIRPIAMEGDQWARENLQVLCERCNKQKTARDMGRIARWKRYHPTGTDLPEDNTRQVPLTEEA